MTSPRSVASIVLTSALTAFGWCGARAGELPPLPSLRHLTFAVEVTVKDEYEKRQINTTSVTSGLIRRSAMTAGQHVPPDVRTAAYDRQLKGEIACDVVAATSDGGLVVDVSEQGSERSSPRIRVAIEPNGHLAYSPATPLFDEEVALLRLLARSVIGSQPHDVGTSWVVEDNGKGYATKTTFRVTAVQGGSDLRLDVDGEFHQDGIDTIVGAVQGKLAYDQSKLVPRTATLDSQSRRETPDGYRTLRVGINLTLLQDSFAPITPRR